MAHMPALARHKAAVAKKKKAKTTTGQRKKLLPATKSKGKAQEGEEVPVARVIQNEGNVTPANSDEAFFAASKAFFNAAASYFTRTRAAPVASLWPLADDQLPLADTAVVNIHVDDKPASHVTELPAEVEA
jgi:hypothetical protein